MNNLFFEGNPLGRGASISDVLQAHEKKILDRVERITDIEELTDEFLQGLVRDALVAPINLKANEKTCVKRTEYFAANELPCNRFDHFSSGEKYPKTVATISLPFTGDPELFKHSPKTSTMSFPHGDVVGSSIKWDVIFWGESIEGGDAGIIKGIESNEQFIKERAEKVNEEVKAFNFTLPEKIGKIFQKKYDRLKQENATLDALGIVEEKPDVSPYPSPKKSRQKPQQVINRFQVIITDQLNQMNYNVGDVNNAIQSTEQ